MLSNPIRTRASRRWPAALRLGAALAALAASGAPLHATEIPVPNGDFSDTANDGRIGGGLLGASGRDVPLGAGPWRGSYYGLLGLLAPPTLTIGGGEATITGIAGIDLLGLLANGAYFSQTLPTPYVVGTRYTLSAQVDVNSVLDLAVLGTGNAGLALRANGATLASTVDAAPQLIGLTPLGGTSYLLKLRYDATAPVDGNIDVELLGTPQNLLSLNLFGAVAYADVRLDAAPIPTAPTVRVDGGAAQSATVGMPFAQALNVQVLDVDGEPAPNVVVSFTAPAAGPSAALSAPSATTGVDGTAAVTAIANTVAGRYAVVASAAGVDVPASFDLTNLAGAPAQAIAAGAGAEQSTTILTQFPAPLVVAVADAFGNPVPGVAVDFAAPADGASATLSASAATTDAGGLAQVEATANATAGSYAVVASAAGVDAPATFALTNTPPPGTVLDGAGGSAQSAELGGAFLCELEVRATLPDGSAYAGAEIEFDAPAAGASAVLSDGAASGSTLLVAADADGVARVQATANEVAGDYVVTAALVGADDVDPVRFALRNVESLIFADGFDAPCRPTP
ncbi:MAG TPA: hypothetical protein VGC30_15720 [Dokdonella sp.]